MMTKRDFMAVAVIGAAVGLLVQPIIANFFPAIQQLLNVSGAAIRLGAFLFFLILAPVALFVAALIGRTIPVLYQFAKFAAVGALNSFVDLGVFNLETLLLGHQPGGFAFTAFKTVSFLSATTNSYFWNKMWTFEDRDSSHADKVAKFYSVAIIGGLINVAAASLLYDFAARPGFVSENAWTNIVAPIFGIFCAFMWDFLGYKFFVFKKAAPPAAGGVQNSLTK